MKSFTLLTILMSLVANLLGNRNLSSSYINLCIPFMENIGQFHEDILYGANTFNGSMFITKNGDLTYSLINKNINEPILFKEHFTIKHTELIKGEKKTLTKTNFIKGNNPSNWVEDIPSYEYINLNNISEGISVKLKASTYNVEKLFFVKPYANIEDIIVTFEGVNKLEIADTQELVLTTNCDKISFTAPIAYQINNQGKREYREVSYVINDKRYGFTMGEYDQSRELIIDPLLSSTFLGCNSFDDDYGPSIEIDNDNNVYLCGYTTASTFPYVGGFDDSYNGGKDIFVAKLSPDLTTLLVSTFIGGSGNENEATMIFDLAKENLYIGGYTTSSNFPVIEGAYDTTHNGGMDVYVLKINKELTTLLASSFLGGSGNEGQQWPKLDIAVSQSGNVYLTGLTCSEDFPIFSGVSVDTTYAGGSLGGDAFVAKFNEDLSSLLASTYIGGSGNEWRMSIGIDNNDMIFVCGETESSDFPLTVNSYDSSFNGVSDIFICKYNHDLSILESATCFGKSNNEEPIDISISPDSTVYIAGYTRSSNFTTTSGVFDNSYSGGNRDAYIARFNNSLTTLEACTFLGGNGRDDIMSLLVSPLGKVYVTGNTTSTNFPHLTNSFEDSFHGGIEYGDAFVSIFDHNLTQLEASTYIGGDLDDRALDIHLDSTGNVLIAGYSKSANFPVTNNAYDVVNNGGYGDCFISKFTPDLANDFVGNVPDNQNQFKNMKLNSFPNPFNPSTTIQFELKIPMQVKLTIFNIKGEKCTILINKKLSQGIHNLSFNAKNLSSGVYFCQLITDDKVTSKKILLMK